MQTCAPLLAPRVKPHTRRCAIFNAIPCSGPLVIDTANWTFGCEAEDRHDHKALTRVPGDVHCHIALHSQLVGAIFKTADIFVDLSLLGAGRCPMVSDARTYCISATRPLWDSGLRGFICPEQLSRRASFTKVFFGGSSARHQLARTSQSTACAHHAHHAWPALMAPHATHPWCQRLL